MGETSAVKMAIVINKRGETMRRWKSFIRKNFKNIKNIVVLGSENVLD
jgi:hypothetical protein